MLKRFSVTVTLILGLATLVASCGKSKPDSSRFAEVCATVVKCDPNFATIPDAQKHCQNFFVQLEQKFPNTIDPVMECINTTPCEELSFMACGEKHLQELKGLLPP